MELKQSLKLSQQLVMTPQLQQAIKLLQLSRLELVDLVQTEMQENPVLEETSEGGESNTETPETPEANTASEDGLKELAPEKKEINEIDWENYMNDSGRSSLPSTYETPDDLPAFDATLSSPSTIQDHLYWQMQMANLSREEESVMEMIIGNIDDDGYFRADLQDMVQKTGAELEFVEDCLSRVQELDPPGVAARDLKECLFIQSRLLKGSPYLKKVRRVINNHLDFLTNRNFPAIAKALKIDIEEVQAICKLIGEMEPKPGRPFGQDNPQYITPDVYVYKVGADYAIVLNEDGLPKLKISQFYQAAMNEDANANAKEYIQGKIRSAIWLIKSIHQRQRTVYRTMESILKFQRDFFDKGVQHLKPMVLRDVAEDISMHESTISRVTTNKYAHTPHGIFELKFFFNSSISRENQDAVASEAVKSKIKGLINSENPKKPFSDQYIVERLSQEGIKIARRTVAKYRESMGFLSSSKRKKLF